MDWGSEGGGGLGKRRRWIGKARKVGRESEYGGLCKRGRGLWKRMRWVVEASKVGRESEEGR